MIINILLAITIFLLAINDLILRREIKNEKKEERTIENRILWEFNNRIQPILNRHYGMASIPSLFGRERIPMDDVLKALIAYLRIQPYNDKDVLVFYKQGKGATNKTAQQIKDSYRDREKHKTKNR
jgi:hypothetical protein